LKQKKKSSHWLLFFRPENSFGFSLVALSLRAEKLPFSSVSHGAGALCWLNVPAIK